MPVFGFIPPPSKEEHLRARIWAASALAALALLMLMLLIGSPPPPEADLMPPALRVAMLRARAATIERWKLEASPGIEPGYADLQSAASPLRHEAVRPAKVGAPGAQS